MRKSVRELQTKMSSIKRRKYYMKRQQLNIQRLKLTLREHNNTKNDNETLI